MVEKIKKFFLDILFPKLCFNCGREGSYLCEDCQSLLEISRYQYCLCQKPNRLSGGGKCKKCYSKKLDGLYFAIDYQNPLIKKLIQKFKYGPLIKELAETLSLLIIAHFQLLEKKPDFFYPVSPPPKFGGGSNDPNFILIPIPLNEKKLKWRGFNQAEEITKELSKFLNPVRDSGNKESLQKENISNGVKVPLVSNCLLRVKNTYPQVELTAEARKENVKGIFICQNQKEIFGKKILLVDDVYTTGATMEEAARILKESGAKEAWGVVVARAQPGEDKFENV